MAKEKKKFTKPFAAALDYCIRMKGATNDSVGEAAGYKSKGKAIDQIRNERSDGKYGYQRAIAEHFGYTLDAFMDFGNQLIQQQADNHRIYHIDKNGTKKEASTLDRFKQKDLALEIIESLLELESIDQGLLGKIKKDIDSEINYHKGDEKNQGKHRTA